MTTIYSELLAEQSQGEVDGLEVGFDGIECTNVYMHELDNPINRLDPTGLQAQSATGPTTGPTSGPALPSYADLMRPITGSGEVAAGKLSWSLDRGGNFNITFTPTAGKCPCTQISFIQVIHSFTVDGVTYYPNTPGENKSQDELKKLYQPFETDSGSRVDFLQGEKDPYYGAVKGAEDWKAESGYTLGNGMANPVAAAHIDDAPSIPNPNHKIVNMSFEIFAVCIARHVIYGGVNWGLEYDPAKSSQFTLTGATNADFHETPSPEWTKAVQKFNGVDGMSQFPLQ